MSAGIVTARVRTTGEPVRVIVLDSSQQSMLAIIRACSAAMWFTLEAGMVLRYQMPGSPVPRRANIGDAFVVNDRGEAVDVLAAGYFARHYVIGGDATA